METFPPFPPSTAPQLPPLPIAVSSGDRALAILCHLSPFIGVGLVLPLIVYLVKRTESEFVAVHSAETLNFHISLLIYAICAIPFVFLLIGIPVLIAIGLVALVCAIIAAFKASESRLYHYPLTIRFFR